jgi:hypothetical protein
MDILNNCYALCDFTCGNYSQDFDIIREKETLFKETLTDLCHSNIGFYSDRSFGDQHFLTGWREKNSIGVYILWHKDDYCPKHNLFHMKSLYVGKGFIQKRLVDHWKSKNFSEEMIVYFSYLSMENRQAKYYEQLLLDLYSFPHNNSENSGKGLLCAHFTQFEVD